MNSWGYKRQSYAEFEENQQKLEAIMETARDEGLPLLDRIQEQIDQAAQHHKADLEGFTRTAIEVIQQNPDIFRNLSQHHIRVGFVFGKGRDNKDHVMVVGSPYEVPEKMCYPLNYFNKNSESVLKVWNKPLYLEPSLIQNRAVQFTPPAAQRAQPAA